MNQLMYESYMHPTEEEVGSKVYMTTTKNFISKVNADGELKPLPHLQNCIKEAHRINPPVPISAFMTNSEPIKLKIGKG